MTNEAYHWPGLKMMPVLAAAAQASRKMKKTMVSPCSMTKVQRRKVAIKLTPESGKSLRTALAGSVTQAFHQLGERIGGDAAIAVLAP